MADAETTGGLRAAICCVMADLKRLKKADQNKFAHYDFTSVDDFKDALRPLMAKHGLSIHVTQSHFGFVEMEDDKGKKRQIAQFDFEITLRHDSGEEDVPESMTVALPYTGAQTSGAARSYAIKEWMKSRFLASAGDMQEEADLLDQSREGLRLSKTDARPLYTELQKELAESAKGSDHEEVAAWWKGAKERLDSLPKDWFLSIKNEYAETWTALKAEADLDKMSNEELDRLCMEQGGEEHEAVQNMMAG